MPRKVTPADRFRKGLMEAAGAASLDFSGYCQRAAQAELKEQITRVPLLTRADVENTLAASDAPIRGDTPKYVGLSLGQRTFDSIGSWTGTADTIAWTCRAVDPATFKVVVSYAADPTSVSNRYAVSVGGEQVTATVEATGGPDSFRSFIIGTASVTAAGEVFVTVKPLAIAAGSKLMEHNAVRLVPVNK
ncbi:MAG: hypothetical protein ACPMAQ_11030 [Phycisphaerae bacterium]